MWDDASISGSDQARVLPQGRVRSIQDILHRLRLLVAQQREGRRGSRIVLEPVGQELHVPGDVMPLPAREAGVSLMSHHFEAEAFVQALAGVVRAGHNTVHRFDALCGA